MDLRYVTPLVLNRKQNTSMQTMSWEFSGIGAYYVGQSEKTANITVLVTGDRDGVEFFDPEKRYKVTLTEEWSP